MRVRVVGRFGPVSMASDLLFLPKDYLFSIFTIIIYEQDDIEGDGDHFVLVCLFLFLQHIIIPSQFTLFRMNVFRMVLLWLLYHLFVGFIKMCAVDL